MQVCFLICSKLLSGELILKNRIKKLQVQIWKIQIFTRHSVSQGLFADVKQRSFLKTNTKRNQKTLENGLKTAKNTIICSWSTFPTAYGFFYTFFSYFIFFKKKIDLQQVMEIWRTKHGWPCLKILQTLFNLFQGLKKSSFMNRSNLKLVSTFNLLISSKLIKNN